MMQRSWPGSCGQIGGETRITPWAHLFNGTRRLFTHDIFALCADLSRLVGGRSVNLVLSFTSSVTDMVLVADGGKLEAEDDFVIFVSHITFRVTRLWSCK
jgi:hypothetical protein